MHRPGNASVRLERRVLVSPVARTDRHTSMYGGSITTGGPLPDDHAAAAVWWRISRHLTPTVAAQTDPDHTYATACTSRLA